MAQINLTQNPHNLPGFRVSWTPNPFPHIITESGERIDIRHVRTSVINIGMPDPGDPGCETGEVEYEILVEAAESKEADVESHPLLTGTATPERVAKLFGDLYLVPHLYLYRRNLGYTPPDIRAEDIRDDKVAALAVIEVTDVERFEGIHEAGHYLRQSKAMVAAALAGLRATIEGFPDSLDCKGELLAGIQEAIDALPDPNEVLNPRPTFG